jgi:Family of unknown function (DUF5681)
MKHKARKGSSAPYDVGYRRPPKIFQFQKGHSGNPAGINQTRARSGAPDLKVSLARELKKHVKIKSGKQTLTVTQAAAGIGELVRQFAKGDHRARRDLILLCDKLAVDLTSRETLQGALEDALSPDDEALLADFVRRHGGKYPGGGDDAAAQVGSVDDALLIPPAGDAKLLPAPSDNPTAPQTMKRTDRDE